MKTKIKIVAIAGIAIATGFGLWRFWGSTAEGPKFKTARIESGPLTAVVSSTGTLNPVVSVSVGSQVSGQIKELFVDFNSPVKAGQMIARIDPETFQYRVRQAEADLEATRSSVTVQRAQRLQTQVNLADAERDYARKKLLVEKNFISAADRDKAQTLAEASRAQLQLVDAQIKNTEALVKQKEAQLAQARVDLEHTSIRSPVDGLVVKRSVDSGQTVAASLQAPELFIIARNLTDMQVETSIDEADVGRVQVGQKASFTVDAFPGRNFEGEVRQVRKAAQVSSNVVTYVVVVSAANPDQTLLPGMTANVRVVTAQKDKTLKVANAALRFKPPGADAATAAGAGAGQSAAPGGAPPNVLAQMRERLIKDLTLDAEQQGRLDGILAAVREKFAAAREQPEADRPKAMERARADMRDRINGILSDEQKKKYALIVAESQASRTAGGGAGRVWVLDAAGTPKAVNVRLGITDGTATEIFTTELADGAEVLTGVITSNGKTATPPPRMF